MAQMTQGQRRTTIQALDDTQRALNKEMSYLPQNRKMDQITFYHRHIAKLVNMLETNETPDVFCRS